MDELLSQRRSSLFRDECALDAIGVFVQLLIGFSLYLYGSVSTPGYLALLLTIPYILLLLGLGRFLLVRTPPDGDPVSAAVGNRGAVCFYLMFALIHLADAQLTFYALCALLQDVLPEQNPLWTALAVAAGCAYALDSRREHVLPRLGRVTKWVVGALLLYCLACAVPHGKTAHFFPLLGYGPGSIFIGALWLCGAVCGGVWPLLTPRGEDLASLYSPTKAALFPWLRAVFFGVLAYAVSVWLMPVYSLARASTVGWRLLLLAHMTPSIPAWSMEVTGLILLFLLCLARSANQTCAWLSRCAGQRKSSRFLPLLILLFAVPASVLKLPAIQRFFVAAAPFRALLMLVLLSLLCAVQFIKGKREGRP